MSLSIFHCDSRPSIYMKFEAFRTAKLDGRQLEALVLENILAPE